MDVDLERDLEVDLESLLSETVKSLASPVKLACALFTERFFDEAELRRFGSDVSVCEQREILLTCLKKKLNRSNEPDGNCGNTSGKYIIKVIASLLIHHNDVLLGKKLLHSCGDRLNLDQEKYASLQQYNILKYHQELVEDVSKFFQPSKLSDILTAVEEFPELRSEVEVVESTPEALKVVCDHLSLMNVSYLEDLSSHFHFEEATMLIAKHKSSIQQFCDTTIQKADKLPLMPNFTQALLTADQVQVELDWDPDKKTLFDVNNMLLAAFNEFSRYVMVHTVFNCEFVIVECYAAQRLHGVLTRLIVDEKEKLLGFDVISISIGGVLILERNLKCEELQKQCDSYKAEIQALEKKVDLVDSKNKVLRYENSPLRCARIPVNTEEEAVRVELKMKTGMMKEINHLTERNRELLQEKETLVKQLRSQEEKIPHLPEALDQSNAQLKKALPAPQEETRQRRKFVYIFRRRKDPLVPQVQVKSTEEDGEDVMVGNKGTLLDDSQMPQAFTENPENPIAYCVHEKESEHVAQNTSSIFTTAITEDNFD